MKFSEKTKKLFKINKVIEFIKRYLYIIPFGLSFYILDFFLRYSNLKINFGGMYSLTANSFTLAWITLFASFYLMFKGKFKKIYYHIIISFFIFIFLLNYIYSNVFDNFFTLKTITLVGEGTDYLSVIFDYINLPVIITLIVCILLVYTSLKLTPKNVTKSDQIMAFVFFILAFVAYGSGRFFLGKPADKLAWDAWNYKRNIYNDYDQTRKSFQTSGLYEYTIRDFKLSIFNNKKANADDIKYLDSYFVTSNKNKTPSKYMNIFEDKNIVFVLMESIDNWLTTKENMPTLYKLMNEGINFTNHYSPIYGGGATFNTEFMINTGYMTPFNGGSAAYSFNENVFPLSLPNLFRKKGYNSINEFHLNYATFYNRGQMSKVFGYDNYYGSLDMEYSRPVAIDDSHFMNEKELRDLILPDDKFMSFIVTYSAHVFYTTKGLECQIAIPNEKDRKEAMKDEEVNCVKAQAGLTDNFFKLLLENLEQKGILDNTVIVGISDHYTYGITDKERLYDLKGVSDANLIHKTPFFIWSNDIDHLEVTDINTNLDIVPTLAYMFGLDYNPNYYLGTNIFDEDYDGLVFFADYSWVDNKLYYKNNIIEAGEQVNKEYINEKNKKINTILDINKRVLETNYFIHIDN